MSGDVLAAVADRLAAYSFMYTTEADLQAGALKALTADFPASTVDSEVRLGSQAERIDLVLHLHPRDLAAIRPVDPPAEWRVGVEVKIAGSAQSVRRQLERYAKTRKINELILLTTRASHERELNRDWTLGLPQGDRPGCPLRVVRVRWL